MNLIQLNRIKDSMFVKFSKLFRFYIENLSKKEIEYLISVHDNHKGTIGAIKHWHWDIEGKDRLIYEVIITNHFTRAGIQNKHNGFFLHELLHLSNENWINKEFNALKEKFNVIKEVQYFLDNIDKIQIEIEGDIYDWKQNDSHFEKSLIFIQDFQEKIKKVRVRGEFNSIFEISKLKRKGLASLNELIVEDESENWRINWGHILDQILDIKSFTYWILEAPAFSKFTIHKGIIFLFNSKLKKFKAYCFESLKFKIWADPEITYFDDINIEWIRDNVIILGNIWKFTVQNLMPISINDDMKNLLNSNDVDLYQEDNVMIQSSNKFEVSLEKYAFVKASFNSITIKKEIACITDDGYIILKSQNEKNKDIEIWIPNIEELKNKEKKLFLKRLFNLDINKIKTSFDRLHRKYNTINLFIQNKNTLQTFEVCTKDLEKAKKLLQSSNNKSNLKRLIINTVLNNFNITIKKELKRPYMLKMQNINEVGNNEEPKDDNVDSQIYNNQQDVEEENEESTYFKEETDDNEEVTKPESKSKNLCTKYEIIFIL